MVIVDRTSLHGDKVLILLWMLYNHRILYSCMGMVSEMSRMPVHIKEHVLPGPFGS